MGEFFQKIIEDNTIDDFWRGMIKIGLKIFHESREENFCDENQMYWSQVILVLITWGSWKRYATKMRKWNS